MTAHGDDDGTGSYASPPCFMHEVDPADMGLAEAADPQLTWIKKGTRVPGGSATARINATSRAVANGDRAEDEIDIADWLGGTRSVKATEEVIGLGSYGKTLTVLSCPSVQDETYREEDDGDDDEDLAERWTPRFRR